MGVVDVRAADALWTLLLDLNRAAWNEDGGYLDPEDTDADHRYAGSAPLPDGSPSVYGHVEAALMIALTHVAGGRADRADQIREALLDSGEDVAYHVAWLKPEIWDPEDAVHVRTFRVPNVWPDGSAAALRVEVGPVVAWSRGRLALPSFRVSVDGTDVAVVGSRAVDATQYNDAGWGVHYPRDKGSIPAVLDLLAWLYADETDADRTRIGDWVRMRRDFREAVESGTWSR